ncbi:hypothetical protein C1646_763139 [Rhizophagus diaphanus]|nr:hypothetical protein C1646_763139 [Rhizophagus diaphanus] [Rhizophagus sp. MUCL 43196]
MQMQVQVQKQKQKDNFDTFPCDSFLKKSIIGYDDEDYKESHFSAKNSTTILKHHIKSKHPNVYNNLKQEEIKTILWTAETHKEKHKLFVNWIITDQQPFTIVENQNFKKFIASI